MTAPTPGIPSFLDGVTVDAQDLQDLSSNLADFYARTMGGFRTHPPLFRAVAATAQTVANNADVLLNFATESFDSDNMFNPATPNQFVIVTPGIYQVGFHAHLAPVTAGAAAVQLCRLTRNSTSPAIASIAARSVPIQSNSGSAAACSTKIRLVAGDVLRCYVRQNSGNSTSILLTHGGARVFAYWIAP